MLNSTLETITVNTSYPYSHELLAVLCASFMFSPSIALAIHAGLNSVTVAIIAAGIACAYVVISDLLSNAMADRPVSYLRLISLVATASIGVMTFALYPLSVADIPFIQSAFFVILAVMLRVRGRNFVERHSAN